MNKNSVNRPNLKILYWTGFVLCSISIWYLLSVLNPIVSTYGDYVQYWAAGRLMILGNNPYSSDLVQGIRHQLGIFIDQPPNAVNLMLYPPWSIPFVIPYGIIAYPLSRFTWFATHLMILFFCARLIWHLYKGPNRLHWVAYLVAFTFTPTLYLLLMGHITSLHLLGILSFLYFIEKPGHNVYSDFLAGACAALVTIKPQLLMLFMLALLFWVIVNRRWMILVGAGLSIFLLSSIPMLINPKVFTQYYQAITSYSLGLWASPALGTVLRLIFGYEKEWLQIIPTIMGVIWFLFYWIKNYRHWNWLSAMPHIVLVSYLTSPYLWPYDVVVLMLPILVLSIELIKRKWNWLSWLIIILYILVTAASGYQLLFIDNNFFLFWLVPAYFGWYLIGKWVTKSDLLLIQNAET